MEICLPHRRSGGSSHEVSLFIFLFLPQWCKAPSSHLRLAAATARQDRPPSLSSSPAAECEPTSGVKRPENWDKKVHVGQPAAQRRRCGSSSLLRACLGKQIYGDNDLRVLLLCRYSPNGAGSLGRHRSCSRPWPTLIRPTESRRDESGDRISGHLD